MEENLRTHARTIEENVGKKMFDMESVIRLCLVALYTNGHVLLEGNPGLGKTSLVKTLAEELHYDDGRIQFTPDLMPADITGSEMPSPDDPEHKWEFRRGPIFRQLLLADEINRATPKTQSAMLEAMAEGRVTRPGTGQPVWLPEPFMVLATQNPIDQEGTYNLPEAQADRFMFKILMPVPGKQGLERILGKAAGPDLKKSDQKLKFNKRELTEKERNDGKEHFIQAHDFILDVKLDDPVRQHIHNLYLATNHNFAELGLARQAQNYVETLVNLLSYGFGPRAPIALQRAVQGWVALFGANPLNTQGKIYDANNAFPQIVLPVLRHRIRLEFGWEAKYEEYWRAQPHWNEVRAHFTQKPNKPVQFLDGFSEAQRLEFFMTDLCLATAPDRIGRAPSRDYYTMLQTALVKQMPKGVEKT